MNAGTVNYTYDGTTYSVNVPTQIYFNITMAYHSTIDTQVCDSTYIVVYTLTDDEAFADCIPYVRLSVEPTTSFTHCISPAFMLNELPETIAYRWTGSRWDLDTDNDAFTLASSFSFASGGHGSLSAQSFTSSTINHAGARHLRIFSAPFHLVDAYPLAVSSFDISATNAAVLTDRVFDPTTGPCQSSPPIDPWSPPFTPPTFDGIEPPKLQELPEPPEPFQQPFNEVLGYLNDLNWTNNGTTLQAALARWRTNRLGLPHPNSLAPFTAATNYGYHSWSFNVPALGTIDFEIDFADWSDELALFRLTAGAYAVFLALVAVYDNLKRA